MGPKLRFALWLASQVGSWYAIDAVMSWIDGLSGDDDDDDDIPKPPSPVDPAYYDDMIKKIEGQQRPGFVPGVPTPTRLIPQVDTIERIKQDVAQRNIATTPTSDAKLDAANYRLVESRTALETTSATIRVGSRGELVKEVQSALNKLIAAGLSVDGIFGPRTEAAVKTYQRGEGLVADGIVGPKTWAAIEADYASRSVA